MVSLTRKNRLRKCKEITKIRNAVFNKQNGVRTKTQKIKHNRKMKAWDASCLKRTNLNHPFLLQREKLAYGLLHIAFPKKAAR